MNMYLSEYVLPPPKRNNWLIRTSCYWCNSRRMLCVYCFHIYTPPFWLLYCATCPIVRNTCTYTPLPNIDGTETLAWRPLPDGYVQVTAAGTRPGAERKQFLFPFSVHVSRVIPFFRPRKPHGAGVGTVSRRHERARHREYKCSPQCLRGTN